MVLRERESTEFVCVGEGEMRLKKPGRKWTGWKVGSTRERESESEEKLAS